MAERSAERPGVCLEFAFDRLLSIKLQQVYGLLVANCARPVGQSFEENRGYCRRFALPLINLTYLLAGDPVL
jgi:hypothetical protein